MNFPTHKIVKTSALVPYASNSRTHSEPQIEKIAASIKEFGFLNPIIIDGANGIIAGHGRVLAAQKLNLETLPCIEAAHLTEAQKRAYIIADNRLALDAGWDDDLLRVELSDLQADGFDLSLTGFEDFEIGAFLADKADGLTDPDDAPELEADAVTMNGDVWLLGHHRLRCGDSTDADDVAVLLGDVKPHLMVTDPPYGVEYDPDWRNRSDRANGKPYGARAVGKVQNDDRANWSEAYALFPGDVAYVWHPPGANSVQFYADLEACGFEVRMQIIWAKPRFPIGRGNYHVQHEPCWYAVRKKSGATAHWQGSRKESTLWHIEHRKSETGHGTQKPIDCMRRPIVNNSSSGQAVYDPFCGSGTTIIAGEMEGRHVFAMELDERYCDVIARRWQEFTGSDATLEGDGRTFDEIQSHRNGAKAA